MKKIPLWVVASLGQEVVLLVEYVGPCETYLPGCRGTLTSIQVADDGSFYTTVALDPNDPGYWENFTFDQIRPVPVKVGFSLDIEQGYIAF